ncbi:hypothetical protein N9095_00785 [bacterium]|nr:hypothetical protein [bacterium]
MATWKAVLGATGAAGYIPSQAFFCAFSRINYVPNREHRLQCGDSEGNAYFMTMHRGNQHASRYTSAGQYQEYALHQFDKDADYQSTGWVYPTPKNSFMESSGSNLYCFSDDTILASGFLEDSSISSLYPLYMGEWSPSTFTSGPDTEFALSATANHYLFGPSDNIVEDSSGNKLINSRVNPGSGYRHAILKYNSDFTSLIWGKYLTGMIRLDTARMTTDDSDNIYMIATGSNYRKVNIVKLNSSGVVQWSREIGENNQAQTGALAINPSTGDLIYVYRDRYVLDAGNQDAAIVVSLDVSNGQTINWKTGIRAGGSGKSLIPVSCDCDVDGNIYIGLDTYLTGTGGYRYSWGISAVTSLDKDGNFIWANAFDPDGKDSYGGQDFGSVQLKSCSYDKHTHTLLLHKELNKYNGDRWAGFARVPADGSLSDASVEHSIGYGTHAVCYFPVSNAANLASADSSNIYAANYTHTLTNNALSNTATNIPGSSSVTRTSNLNYPTGNVDDSASMYDADIN